MTTVVSVTKEHRRAAAELAGYSGQCANAFIVGDWGLCTCKGNSHPAREMERAAQRFAELETKAVEAARTAERADVVAWLRDRDRAAEDVFCAAYSKPPRGAGHAEGVYRGVLALADAIERGELT